VGRGGVILDSWESALTLPAPSASSLSFRRHVQRSLVLFRPFSAPFLPFSSPFALTAVVAELESVDALQVYSLHRPPRSRRLQGVQRCELLRFVFFLSLLLYFLRLHPSLTRRHPRLRHRDLHPRYQRLPDPPRLGQAERNPHRARLEAAIRRSRDGRYVSRSSSLNFSLTNDHTRPAGQIPGLTRVDVGLPLEVSKARSQGWDVMLYAELGSAEALNVYAPHPAHEEYKALNAELGTGALPFPPFFPFIAFGSS
jgi:hypothetical protein